MDTKLFLKFSFLTLLLLLLVVPIILQYVFTVFFVHFNRITITIYGWYILFYLLLQFVLSFLNNRSTTQQAYKHSLESNVSSPFIALVVGYKENPSYFRNCLTSISLLQNTHKVFVVIDGNTADDQYMIDIFLEIFPSNSLQFVLDTFPNPTDLSSILPQIQHNKFICISQPHAGKRHVMYTGFFLNILLKKFANSSVDHVLCTDSDTVLDPSSGSLMSNLIGSSESIGGVAGNLGIFDKYTSFISFSSSLRYWFAFNLERAYQSFNNYVLCISGPIGMYKLSVLEKIIDEWKSQTFFGQPCTFGDDRHLTNKILQLGYRVLFLPSASAETETPSSLYMFFKQQTRWSKSAYREILWTFTSIHKHSAFMTIDIVYTMVYPFLVMGYLLYVLYAGTNFDLALYLSIILFFGIVKSLYGAILGIPENLLFLSYGLVYLSVVFPAKLWALCTLTDISWGTSSRKLLQSNFSFDILCLVGWNIVLLVGIILHFTQSHIDADFYFLVTILSIWILVSVIVLLYTNIKNYKSKKSS
jgi:hyaluronan synthase